METLFMLLLIPLSASSLSKPSCDDYEENSPRCSNNGHFHCGKCECRGDFVGERCECVADPWIRGNMSHGCMEHQTSTNLCNNRGACECGQCVCHPRSIPTEMIYGQFCECDNFSCDRYNGQVCSGHGECVCGECFCEEGWQVPGFTACECSDRVDTCIDTRDGAYIDTRGKQNQQVCSGHGTCHCGQCRCDGEYAGKFCEECPTCSNMCLDLKSCVECKVFRSGNLFGKVDELGDDLCDRCTDAYYISVDKVGRHLGDDLNVCMHSDDDDCLFVFGYEYEKDELIVFVEETKECPAPGAISGTPAEMGLMKSMMEIIKNIINFFLK